MDGVFLKRGAYTYPLDEEKLWKFEPLASVGDSVSAGAWLGVVDENHQAHKIMVPFVLTREYRIKELKPAGDYTVKESHHLLQREAKTFPPPRDGRPCNRYLEPNSRGRYRFYPRSFRYG